MGGLHLTGDMAYFCDATNVHLHACKVDHKFVKHFEEAWGKFATALQAFKPDFLLLSAGFDAHKEETAVMGASAGFGVSASHFRKLTKLLLKAVPREVPCVSVLEGGYGEVALRDGLAEHLQGLYEASN